MEAALVLFVFLVVLIGIFDLAQVFLVHQMLVDRVQRAARWAAVNPFEPAKIQNLVLYNQVLEPPGAPPGVFGVTASMVSAVQVDADTEDARIVVTLHQYPYKVFSPLLRSSYQIRPIVVSVPQEN